MKKEENHFFIATGCKNDKVRSVSLQLRAVQSHGNCRGKRNISYKS